MPIRKVGSPNRFETWNLFGVFFLNKELKMLKNEAIKKRKMVNNILKIFILSGLVVLLFDNKSFSLTTIELKEKVWVNTDRIFLEDIANLSDTVLDKIYIGKSPLPGRERYITQDYVRLRILQAKIKEGDFQLTGAKRVNLVTASQKLDMEELTNIVKNYLLKVIKTNQRLEIKPIASNENIILPVGKVEFGLGTIDSQNLKRQLYLPVDIKVDGFRYRTVRMGFEIRRFANVLIAVKPLDRFHVLTPLDVRFEEKEITCLNPAPLEEIISKRLKIPVLAGKILTYDLIETPPLIKRGDIVTIKMEGEFLIVGTKGVAKEDGRLGDKIRVENRGSKKIIIGIVEDNETVVVK
ncbi:MAG: flagellar basal body P-ring formation chaperone FlgA [bacterium]|nr:flagellar basal body P-ring formation chaperone FlgA [bacterium]